MAPAQQDLPALTQSMLTDMRAALAGAPASTLMLPSHLYGSGTAAHNQPVIVLDAGGTNFRCALVTLTDQGPVVESLSQTPMPGTHGTVHWQDLICHFADHVEPLLSRSSRIGICFSYSADPQPAGDSLVLNLNKEISIRGGEGRPVGADLHAELARRGHHDLQTVVLNDTLAVQFGVAAAHQLPVDRCLGLVCGTGANVCCALPVRQIPKLGQPENVRPMLVNCETGFFTGVRPGEYDWELDACSQEPGRYLHEKMVSGAYLGPLCLRTLQGAARDGLFSPAAAKLLHELQQLSSAQADSLSGPLATLVGADRETADAIVSALFDRSAKAVCAALTAVMTLVGGTAPLFIGAEGSLFQKSRRFRQALDGYMDAYPAGERGFAFSFRTAQNTTLVGAACAALLMDT